MSQRPALPSRRDFLLGAGGVATVACFGCGPELDRLARATQSVLQENAKAGSSGWLLQKGSKQGEVEGYARRSSVVAGEQLEVCVSVRPGPARVRWTLFRLGHYQGQRARQVDEGGPVQVQTAPEPLRRADGLVECAWAPTFVVKTHASWASGVYLLKLTREDGYESYVSFLVRAASTLAEIAVMLPTTTWAAYNSWGGASLYSDARRLTHCGRAYRVSMDRPNDQGFGAGTLLSRELSAIAWLEAQGLELEYLSTEDLEEEPHRLLSKKVLLIPGHDEYWTSLVRRGVDDAVGAGVSLMLLSANTGYWHARLEHSSDQRPRRILTCFKGDALKLDRDPFLRGGPSTLFRNPAVGLPERKLFGVAYDDCWNTINFPMVVAQAGHWAFGGTGLSSGDTFWQATGYETDTAFFNGKADPRFTILCDSPHFSVNKPVGSSQMVLREMEESLVFAAGSVDFVRLLSSETQADPRAGRLVANILYAALRRALPSSLPSFDARARGAAEKEGTGPSAQRVSTWVAGKGSGGRFISPEPGALISPLALASHPDGGFVVSDVGDASLKRIDAQGRVTRLTQTPFRSASGLAVDREGRVYVSHGQHHMVSILLADGSLLTLGKPGQALHRDGSATTACLGTPGGMAVSPQGDVFIADLAHNAIRVLRFQGGVPVMSTLVSTGLSSPSAVAWTPAGLYITETGGRVLMYSDRLEWIAGSGVPGFKNGAASQAQFLSQYGIAALPDGSVAVSDGGNYQVRRVTRTEVSTLAGSGRFGRRDGAALESDLVLPGGLAMGADGQLYVAETGAGAVRIIHL